MRSVRLKKSLALGLLCTGLLGPSAEAFVRVSPSVVELVVKPGKKAKGQILVTNPSAEDTEVIMEVQDWWKQQTGREGLPLKQWLTLSPSKSFKLGPGKSRTLKYKVRLPPDWSGETMAMVFFSINTKTSGQSFSVQMRHGIPIYAISATPQEAKLNIAHMDVGFVHGSTSSVRFYIVTENPGSIHVRPKGTVSVFSNEALVDSAPVDWGWPVYPGRQHQYSATTPGRVWAPGKYKARLTMDYGQMFGVNLSVEKTVEFEVTEQGQIKY